MHAKHYLFVSVASLVLAATPKAGFAQVSVAPAKLSQSYEKVLSTLERQMVEVAKAMPGGQYNFTPATLAMDHADFEGTRTFAATVKHVAEMNYVMYSVMSGLKPDYNLAGIAALKNKDEIVELLVRSFAFAHKALGTLDVTNAGEVPQDADGFTRAGLAAYAMVHDADHYGQLSEYLRMNGIVPPQSRK